MNFWPKTHILASQVSTLYVQEGLRTVRRRASKMGHFSAISLSSVKTVAASTDMLFIITSTSDEILNGVNIDDLE